jgi:transposase
MRTPGKPAEIGLTGQDRRRLGKALQERWDRRTYRRVLAILCVARGYLIQQVARLVGMNPRTIYQWLDCYRQNHRVEDLQDRPRAGRPRVAETISDARIVRELRRDPMKLGYQTTSWTVGLLARHLANRYDCPISARTLRRRLDQMGLAWKRPRYRYKKVENLPQKKGRLSAA